MPRDWEEIFRTWTKPSSETEAEKQANAEQMIGAAIREYEPLRSHEIKIIAQGSYRNNTNVRQESDVDICVCCMEPFFYDLTFADYTNTEAQIIDASYTYTGFKNEVQAALVKKFGTKGVKRGDKAFEVHENSYRVNADVVAAFAHRRYQKKTYNLLLGAYVTHYTEPPGTQFFSDSGKSIINWPEQHYTNGVEKNKRTGYRFKSVVRAIKNLRYDMEAEGNEATEGISSYLLECMVYNVPDTVFTGDSYRNIARNCLVESYNATETEERCKSWVEVNHMKWLFHATQPWAREELRGFLLAAWSYAEFT